MVIQYAQNTVQYTVCSHETCCRDFVHFVNNQLHSRRVSSIITRAQGPITNRSPNLNNQTGSRSSHFPFQQFPEKYHSRKLCTQRNLYTVSQITMHSRMTEYWSRDHKICLLVHVIICRLIIMRESIPDEIFRYLFHSLECNPRHYRCGRNVKKQDQFLQSIHSAN